MDSRTTRRRIGAHGAATTSILALLLVICLAESATGSCRSYGHSCWGAHGKRSTPDLYLTEMLRRMASSDSELNHVRQIQRDNDIFQMGEPDDSSASYRISAEGVEIPLVKLQNRDFDAKPMLSDNVFSHKKLWQIMQEASENNK